MHYSIVNVTPPLSTSVWADSPTAIVLHATAGATGRSSVDFLRSVGLSYHYIIARDSKDTASSLSAEGTIPVVYACVPLSCRAAHVGSIIPFPDSNGRIANRCAIGVSLANRQNGETYPEKQLEALSPLITAIVEAVPTIKTLTTHAVIQPWNRRDPLAVDGPALAAEHGLSWFEPTAAEIEQYTPKKQGKT
jgi:N-acetyl-anhydromuramyl-L-alanine amidase AmpD